MLASCSIAGVRLRGSRARYAPGLWRRSSQRRGGCARLPAPAHAMIGLKNIGGARKLPDCSSGADDRPLRCCALRSVSGLTDICRRRNHRRRKRRVRQFAQLGFRQMAVKQGALRHAPLKPGAGGHCHNACRGRWIGLAESARKRGTGLALERSAIRQPTANGNFGGGARRIQARGRG